MKAPDRRKYPRLRKSFQVQLAKAGLDPSFKAFKGTSVNLSQGGAFIKVDKWRSFCAKDPAKIVFLLPSEFTGRAKTIRLKGRAVIARVDRKNKGIGVEFTRSLKHFEPVFQSKTVMTLSKRHRA